MESQSVFFKKIADRKSVRISVRSICIRDSCLLVGHQNFARVLISECGDRYSNNDGTVEYLATSIGNRVFGCQTFNYLHCLAG